MKPAAALKHAELVHLEAGRIMYAIAQAQETAAAREPDIATVCARLAEAMISVRTLSTAADEHLETLQEERRRRRSR